jgi:hypothetical protein
MGLTVAQVESVSAEIGLPSNRWDEADPITLMVNIYAAAEGITLDEAKKLTVARLTELVAIDDDEESDPTQPSA